MKVLNLTSYLMHIAPLHVWALAQFTEVHKCGLLTPENVNIYDSEIIRLAMFKVKYHKWLRTSELMQSIQKKSI